MLFWNVGMDSLWLKDKMLFWNVGEFVIFAAKLKYDSLLLKERLLSHNGEFVSIKGWKNNGRIVIEPS